MPSSAQPVRTASFAKLRKERREHTLISLFSGCGGAALGFAQAGFEVRVFVEWQKAACDTLRRNWTDELGPRTVKFKTQKRTPPIMQADITKTSTEEILKAADLEVGEATCLEGGFPCQGFSMAGRRLLDDPRNKLYRECVRVIREALPRTFFLENVKGLISMDKGAVIKQICEDLAACGYQITWYLIDCADYGVPQHRERVVILGDRQDVMTFGKRTGLHMGALVGEIRHPDFFIKRYPHLFQAQLPLAA